MGSLRDNDDDNDSPHFHRPVNAGAFSFAIALALALTIMLGASGCGDGPSTSSSSTTTTAASCAAGTAIIIVYDGYFQNVCGCSEPSEIVAVPNLFTCTVSAGTQVTFLFSRGATSSHQILPVGTPAIDPSAVSNPKIHPWGLAHVVNLPSVGTYLFEDSFVPGSQGRLVAL